VSGRLVPVRFVSTERELSAVLDGCKLVACPHCRRTGFLIGHGLLRGYAERSSDVVVRGRRVFCSNRGRRAGCGRTFCIALTSVLPGFLVRTLTLWRFIIVVLRGCTRRAGWLVVAGGALSLSSGYRLWQRFVAVQTTLRVRLCREVSAPASTARDPLAQLLAHLDLVVAAETATQCAWSQGADRQDPFSAFQQRFQRGLFDT
jgi:hypothetical protein